MNINYNESLNNIDFEINNIIKLFEKRRNELKNELKKELNNKIKYLDTLLQNNGFEDV